ncbi:MAG: tRNA (adenosine(37)-N6)-dimethylallyltransferase MiaA [Clostridiales bacterium]|nr:tRNA (adenosine(37)-N6)-dimethylallyltransferase MiaA [Clostridiales bacterium]
MPFDKEREDSRIIAVVGPTASGKTRLGVSIAKAYDGEVISADSMQIYKNMDIACAVPTPEEMQGIRHHLISFVDPSEEYSVARFVADAKNALGIILAENKLPVVVGGSGLYIDCFLNGMDFSLSAADKDRIRLIREKYENVGSEELYAMLEKIDPSCASRLTSADRRRVLRAIEIYETTGRTKTEIDALTVGGSKAYKCLRIGLDFHDREALYSRINARVDDMLERGLIEEARAYYSSGASGTSAAALGYKELKPYLDGEVPLKEAVSELKKKTRNYAKRQLTWFRRDKSMKRIYVDEHADFESIRAAAFQLIDDWEVENANGE